MASIALHPVQPLDLTAIAGLSNTSVGVQNHSQYDLCLWLRPTIPDLNIDRPDWILKRFDSITLKNPANVWGWSGNTGRVGILAVV